MPPDRCVCCDLPVDQCGKAIEEKRRAEEKAERDRALALPGVVAASYPGTCPTCSTRYSVGEPIRRTDDGWSGVLCCPEVVG